MEGDMGEVQRLGQTKTTIKKSKSDREPEQDQEQTLTTLQKKRRRGQGDTSGYARGAAITAAARIKLAKMKRQDQLKDRQERLEKTEKEKRIAAAVKKSDREQEIKDTRKKEMYGSVKGALQGMNFRKAGYTSATQSMDTSLDNVGQLAGAGANAVGGIAKAVIGSKLKKRKDAADETRREKSIKNSQTESYSNWREEFIFEIDDPTVTNNQPEKIIDVSKKKNKIEINPKLSEQKQHLREFLPALLAALEIGGAETAGALAARSAAAGAGESVASSLGSKVSDVLKGKAGDAIKDKLTSKKDQNKSSSSDSIWTGLVPEKQIAKEGFSDWRTEMGVKIEESKKVDKDSMKCNKPKAQAIGDSLTGKSHVVKACEGGTEKIIRFGQRGVKGSPKKEGESKAYASRRHRFQTRHAKNIAKGKMSAAYWANRVKW
jgi:hypothetical protein